MEKIKVLFESKKMTENRVSYQRIVEYNGMKFKYLFDIKKGSNSLNGYGRKSEGGIFIFSKDSGWVQIEDYESAKCFEAVSQIQNNDMYRYPFNEKEVSNKLEKGFSIFDEYIVKVFS